MKITLYALMIVAGIALFVYGGYDDSPGGQLLGVVIAAVALWQLIRRFRSRKS